MSTAQLTTRTNGGWVAEGANGLRASGRFGVGAEPSRDIAFVSGTGDNAIDVIYRRAFTITASGNVDIDLTGGWGELDVLNVALDFAKIRAIDVILTTTPASGVSLRVGPQSQSNGFIGPWQDVDGYDTVRRRWFADNPVAGWTVDGTHKILRLNNPGASSVSGVIEIFGTSA